MDKLIAYTMWGTICGVVSLAMFEAYKGRAFVVGFIAGCVLVNLITKDGLE